MAKFTSYPNKSKPADSDTLLINDASASANKQILLSGLFAWLKDKFTSTPINGLETTNQTIVGAINELHDAVEESSGGSGLTDEVKTALLQLAQKVAYIDDDGQDYYDALEEALYPTVTTMTVSYSLSHVTSSNNASTVTSGASYTATLTASSGYTINTVTVTMGGADVTSTVYSSGTITIPSVTGNIVITATAVSSISSISAVYTQSGTVYFDTPLNDLKTDLVVTAHYSNGTSATVSSGYTLTGTLTAGTSAITVEYGGKTTTFNVTVTAVLYPFENGTHNFTSPASHVTVSNGNTAVITASTANHNDTHANISELSTNTTACNATGNYTGISDPYFTIPAGSTLSCKATITKLVYPISTSNAALAFRDMNGTAVLIMFANYPLSTMTIGQEFSESITVESATDIGCVGLFLGRKANGNECEIGVKIEAYLDGVRII